MLALSITPYRLLSHSELPKSKQSLENWETVDDTWIKRDGQFYNLRDFCTVGAPRIPGPMGGAQVAIGEFAIAGAGDGNLYAVVEK